MKKRKLILPIVSLLTLGALSNLAFGNLLSKNNIRFAAKDETTKYVSVYKNECPTGGTNGYATVSSFEVEDITWNVVGNTTISPWRIGGNSITNQNRYLATLDPFNNDISAIDISFGTANNITVNSLVLNVYSTTELLNNGGNGDIASIATAFEPDSIVTFEKEDNTDWSNCYFRFDFDLTVSGNKNKFVAINYVEFFTKAESLTDAEIAKLTVDSLCTKASLSYKYGKEEIINQTPTTDLEIIAGEKGYSNDDEINQVSDNSDISILFAKNTGSNPPKYYSSDKTFRAYSNNTLTISSTNYNIKSITFTGSFDATLSGNNEPLDKPEWTGSSKSVLFNINSKSSIKSILVTYDKPQQIITTNFEYDSVALRFGGLVEQTVWNKLENVSAYGLFVSSEENFNKAKFDNETSFEEIIASSLETSTLDETLDYLTENKVFDVKATIDNNTTSPRVATSAEVGSETPHYIWNAYVDIPNDHLIDNIYAQAYVIIDSEYVFLDTKVCSVASLADENIKANSELSTEFEGSLQNLADMYVPE